MTELGQIKAILFDSGHVLNRPRTGHWFIPPNFYSYVNKDIFESISVNSIEAAFQKGMEYLEDKNFVYDETEELQYFQNFYRIFAIELPETNLDEYKIRKIAEDTVLNDEKFFFYEDVFEVIPRLSHKYLLGVVSDTWPSLDRVFNNNGLRGYFSTFVMSSKLGVVKPHELMFKTALNELAVKPEEAIFIDDNISNLNGARGLGLGTILMLRAEEDKKCQTDYLRISNLIELEKLMYKS